MRARLVLPLALGCLVVAASASEARADGTVVASPDGASTMTEARLAVATTPGRTTRWASVRVEGTSSSFVWLVPTEQGAMIDPASDAWLEALEAATAPRVIPPAFPAACAVATGVEVEGRVGHVVSTAPTDSALVSDLATLDGHLAAWGITLPDPVAARIYTLFHQGTQVLALRYPATHDTWTRPLRIVDGARAGVPLTLTRLAGPVRVTAFAIGASRATLEAPFLSLDPASVTWSAHGASSYAGARDTAMIRQPDAWLVEGAGHAPLFEVGTVRGTGATLPAIANEYFARAAEYGDATEPAGSCIAAAQVSASSADASAGPCALGVIAQVGPPSSCTPPTVQPFECGGTALDLAHALGGLPPATAWVTRATAIVTSGATDGDVPLRIEPGVEIDGIVTASGYDVVCAGGGGTPGGPPPHAPPAGSGAPGTNPPQGAVVPDNGNNTAADVASTAADGCGAAADSSSGCGGDTSSSDTSGSSCSGSSSDSSGSGCSGSSGGDAGGSCSGASGGGSGNCVVAGGKKGGGRSPMSRIAFVLAAAGALARRASRKR